MTIRHAVDLQVARVFFNRGCQVIISYERLGHISFIVALLRFDTVVSPYCANDFFTQCSKNLRATNNCEVLFGQSIYGLSHLLLSPSINEYQPVQTILFAMSSSWLWILLLFSGQYCCLLTQNLRNTENTLVVQNKTKRNKKSTLTALSPGLLRRPRTPNRMSAQAQMSSCVSLTLL